MSQFVELAQDALVRMSEVQSRYPVRNITVRDRTWQFRNTQGGNLGLRPVLMLAGIQGGGDVFFEVANRLGDNYRLIMVSPPDIADLAEMTQANAAFLDVIGLDKVHVLGSSLGAYLAQDFALSFPARVDQLILANGFFDPALFLAKAPSAAATEREDAASLVGKNMKSMLDQPDSDPGIERLKAVMQALVGPVQTVENYKSRLLLLTNAPALPRPPIPDERVMLIDNDHDPMVLPEMRQALRQRFAAAELHPIDGGGHLPAIQRPDVFNAFVRARLEASLTNQGD